ncbi:MAG: pyridoxal-phosphate dependent enzyme [Candidatus Marinimicrobia bacterium]|nr:pyridoxal-phosphate dependent enzyme [Candidatus Neomarinimicrobiota bacterium]MDD5582464.1 pyridoxal-phosphate dependent enzyme [Candidatus Neomarinimicrobiota bacterium]
MINLSLNPDILKKNIQRCKERNILIPMFEHMKNPEKIPDYVQEELKSIGLWDIHPRNLFRITWKNEPVPQGGGFDGVNYLELPSELTGVKARIIGLVGKWFPTGSHKVGATFGCLVPRLVTGQFDPTSQKAVWPSTGNYCRGGAYNSALLACDSIAILPEEMSKERFEWLANLAGEVIATPGCESNVKEIFDACKELKQTRGKQVMIFNQFDELGNHLWHYEVTGHAMEEVLQKEMKEGDRFSAVVSASGSAGTLACGDYLKEKFPLSKIVVAEALQCPTLLSNGFGGHRIEGIGDKHVPWIHNVKNTDFVIAVDDEHTIRLMRLFNEKVGREYLIQHNVSQFLVEQLDLLGISSIGNMVAAIKYAKYNELTEKDIILTVFTDSMELYGSRMQELQEKYGDYSREDAIRDFEILSQLSIDYMLELDYYSKKRIHNLKYYTWIEQQGKSLDELNTQWYDAENYWGSIHQMAPKIDELIEAFNKKTGLLK